MKNLFNRFALNAEESAVESLEAVVESLKNSQNVEEATEAIADMSIKWHPEEFLPNLKYMGIGMLCIFIVIGVIILSIFLVNFCVNRFSKDGKAKKVKKEKNTDENGQNNA